MFRLFYLFCSLCFIAWLVIGFFGFLHPAFDTFSHFRWLVSLALLGLSVIGLVLPARRAAFILLAFSALGIWQSNANNRIGLVATPPPLSHDYSLLYYNLRFDNPMKKEVVAMLLKHDADIIALVETTRLWQQSLAKLDVHYPYHFHCPEWNGAGGGIVYSKYKINDRKDYCHKYAALGITQIQLPHGELEFGLAHIRWPWPGRGPKEVEALKPRLQALSDDALIVGDFNATSWSHSVRSFIDHGGLKLAFGYGGTFMPNWMPSKLAPMFGLPIDHVMSKGRIWVSQPIALPSIGSDHLPLLVRFGPI